MRRMLSAAHSWARWAPTSLGRSIRGAGPGLRGRRTASWRATRRGSRPPNRRHSQKARRESEAFSMVALHELQKALGIDAEQLGEPLGEKHLALLELLEEKDVHIVTTEQGRIIVDQRAEPDVVVYRAVRLMRSRPIPCLERQELAILQALPQIIEIPRDDKVFLPSDGKDDTRVRKELIQPLGDETLVLRLVEGDVLVRDENGPRGRSRGEMGVEDVANPRRLDMDRVRPGRCDGWPTRAPASAPAGRDSRCPASGRRRDVAASSSPS